MVVRLVSVANWGLEAVKVEVEVDVSSRGLPGLSIVGLASKATEEAKDRVRLAIGNSGFDFPQKKIVVNLAPADLPKEGSAYDLAIAIGILIGAKMIAFESIYSESIFYAELALDGRLRHTSGTLTAAMGARKLGMKKLFVARSSAAVGALIAGIEVYPVASLAELVRHLTGNKPIKPLNAIQFEPEPTTTEVDLAEVVGLAQAKRALEITAAGGHHLLMSGPPGSGKTMLARCLPGILPSLNLEEKILITQIQSLAGILGEGEALVRQRPFRSPHHSISAVGLVGGGNKPRPGEVSLAHFGVLFLDEMAEFPRLGLESLRQPLEDGRVSIVRAAGRVSFPSQFSLVGAVNPCPCGYRGHPQLVCRCTPRQVEAYRQKLSGPILDRIDLRVWVPVQPNLLPTVSRSGGESSETVRARVEKARERQYLRLAKFGLTTNASMGNRQLKATCPLPAEGEALLKQAMRQFQLSSRAVVRVIKVARTIADLADSEPIQSAHIAEAIQYRVVKE